MNKSKKLLPLGSIVYLEEGTQKLVIVGRGAIFEDPETGEQVFADYMGSLYPAGLQTNSTLFFQHENIDEVVFAKIIKIFSLNFKIPNLENIPASTNK